MVSLLKMIRYTVLRAQKKIQVYLRRNWFIVALGTISVIMFLALVGWATYLHFIHGLTWAQWTGFSQYVDADGKIQRGKTLWDWLELLIIPLVLAVGAFYLQRSEKESERRLAEQHREEEHEKVKDQQRETALQGYIDKMTELLLDKNDPLRKSSEEDEVRVVARTRTMVTLRSLDSFRKALLLRFLYEAKLITPNESGTESDEISKAASPIIDLDGANLDGAELGRGILNEAHLRKTNLYQADLRWARLLKANLSEANLNKADLTGASLNSADLSGAYLFRADLSIADLDMALLYDAQMGETILQRASLNRANLSGAKLQKAFMREASLRKAILVEADLRDAILNVADMTDADLTNANMTGATLIGTNFSRAIVTEEQLASAKYIEDITMPDGRKYDPRIHTFRSCSKINEAKI